MEHNLSISSGAYSSKGRKQVNQDFHGAYTPEEPLLTSKGIAIALADGISSSNVSQIASESAVRNFLEDYFCTSEAWSVKKSAEQVLVAINSWLYSQTQKSAFRFNKDRGYVCTLSAIILKSTTAHIFHLGDSRVYRLRDNNLEQLTEDHRVLLSEGKSYLSRGLGIKPQVEIDYKFLSLKEGDIFLLVTDGIYEYISLELIIDTINSNLDNLDNIAKLLVNIAYEQGSDDNLSGQVVKIDDLPMQNTKELYKQLTELPFPPVLDARMEFDDYHIIKVIHASSRSHVYLALDKKAEDPNKKIVIKTPSVDLQGDPAYLERFLMEEWIARRINNAHILKTCSQTRRRNFTYIVTEYIDGQTLSQWMHDNPKSDLETIRNIIEQVAKGLLAFHRQEMLHQDLRPENIMIDINGIVKIIDFGAARVAGIAELITPIERENILGTAQYTAPEYFLGEVGSEKSDIFSLGVITYQMITGKLPYGTQVAKSRTKALQNKLQYKSVLDDEREIPAWIDYTLKKVLKTNPLKRYAEISEFLFDLRRPNKEFLSKTKAPLIERNPVIFWKGVSLILATIIILLIYYQSLK
jgi:serine/threonine protein phosphatase PrpC